jgi:hypothetical protein
VEILIFVVVGLLNISGTIQDPLITTSNVIESDLRIFSSDGNATMNKYVVFFQSFSVGNLFV